MTRASYVNQARLHGGYHYPRSFGTAYRSRLNLPRFLADFPTAVVSNFIKLYAIARVGSKVNARQFEKFCKNIDAPVTPARKAYSAMFNPNLVEAVFETEEYVFDADKLASIMTARLESAGVTVRMQQRVREVTRRANGGWLVSTGQENDSFADIIVNCTYSGMNRIGGLPDAKHRIKHEITEMALVQLPPDLAGISVTLMDGPFFSFMPFPDRGLTTLSHVRYTPHASWLDEQSPRLDPYEALRRFPRTTRFPYMIRDVRRYLPALGAAEYRDSLFEVKTVLLRNEFDDGRPILFEDSPPADPSALWVLGSKIDNIYDALSAVDSVLG